MHTWQIYPRIFFCGLLLAAFFVSSAYAEYAEGMEAYRKAWAAYATQRFEEAEAWASRAVRSDPENAHAHALLGDLAYLRHDLAAAKEAWQKALALNPQLGPLRGQLTQVELELELESEGVRPLLGTGLRPVPGGLTPSTLILRVPRDLSAEEEQAILATLTQAVDTLESHFQYRIKRPLTILIYPRKEWGQVLDLSPFAHMPTEVLGLFDGKIRIPATPFREERVPGLRPGTHETVLWHEYAHAVVYDLSHGRAPRWLQEGLAQECELLAIGYSPLANSQQPTADLPFRCGRSWESRSGRGSRSLCRFLSSIRPPIFWSVIS